MRNVTTFVATLLLAAAAAVIGAAPASAVVAKCYGNVIDHETAYYATGVPVLQMKVYYNPATGINCAQYDHLGPSYGALALTHAEIWICAETTVSDECNRRQTDIDAKYYEYYAGPVSANGRGHCIYVQGFMDFQGKHYELNTWETTGHFASHCG